MNELISHLDEKDLEDMKVATIFLFCGSIISTLKLSVFNLEQFEPRLVCGVNFHFNISLRQTRMTLSGHKGMSRLLVLNLDSKS